jgi:pimeloyl-ACP methyl ester carboxylesterase
VQAVPILTAPDGVRLTYQLAGSGPPLLLHLGAGCDAGLWRAAGYLEPLAASRTCILFDHRGHGASDHPVGSGAYHLERFVDDVIALLDLLAIERVAFWGYSNAISVGLRVAAAHPERVERLLLSGTIATGSPGRDELVARIEQSNAAYRATGWETLIAGFEAEEGPVPEWMKARIRATDVGPVIAWNEARLEWGYSAWELLPAVGAPALFVVGELEDPEDTMATAAARMPDGAQLRVPGKGHISAFLDSAFVLPHALAFLTGGPVS